MSAVLRNIYVDTSDKYEFSNHMVTAYLDILWRGKALKYAGHHGKGIWLDLCCGTGEMGILLRKAADPDTMILGADFSSSMLRIAIGKSSSSNTDFNLASAGALPYRDRSFDLVIISFATRNLSFSKGGLTRCLSEILRVLKPGGVFINVETSQPPSRLIRMLSRLYIMHFVMPIHSLLSGSREGGRYLTKTILKFHGPEEFRDILTESGFSDVEYEALFFGVAAIHVARNPLTLSVAT